MWHDNWEPCEGRLSRTVLREAQGEVPWAYLLDLKLQIYNTGGFFDMKNEQIINKMKDDIKIRIFYIIHMIAI